MSEKRNYVKSENYYEELEQRKLKFDSVNDLYFKEFQESKTVKESSLVQYKSAVRRLSESIQKDLLTITVQEVESYLNSFEAGKTKEAQLRYIQSFLKFAIINNADHAAHVTSGDTLLWLLD